MNRHDTDSDSSGGASPVAPLTSPHRALRTVWLTAGGLVAVATFAFGTLNIVSALGREEFSDVLTFSTSDVTSLEVANDDGRIDVVATDADMITVTATVSQGWSPADYGGGVIDGVLELSADCPRLAGPWCSVDYRIEIPADRDVLAEADNGRIEIASMTANVDVRNDNGRVVLRDLAGDVSVRSDNGTVEATGLSSPSIDISTDNGRIDLDFADAPVSLAARSDNGSIDIGVPDEVFDVSTETDNGNIDVAVRTDPLSDRIIDARTDNGSISIRISS